VSAEVQVARCPCGELTGYRCGLCKRCRMRQFGQSTRKYQWTPDLREELKRAYRGRGSELSAALGRLASKTKWPRHALKYEAIRLGIVFADPRRFWRSEEVEYLAERLGSVGIRQVAKHLRRSVSSVEAKADRLGLSCRVREGYNMADLAQVFGVSRHQVQSWLRRGLFGRIEQVQGNRVTEASVVRFLRKYPLDYSLRRIDEEWFKGLMFGYLADEGKV
jgi:transposase-like protein